MAIDPDFCKWKVPNEFIDKIPNLKAICLQTTSFSWIDIEHTREKNIPVINLRGFSSEAVAEWAVMMALNLARKIPLVIKAGWKENYEKHTGIELKGRVAGIIGLGRIGTRIAELCDGFGMEVTYWSKDSKDKRFKYKELTDIFKESDVIFPALAKNDETKAFITDNVLKLIKPTTIFVSIVHEMYNHELLVEMVKERKLFGYGFEEDGGGIFENYEGNIWAGPALGWCTAESFRKNAEQWVEAMIKATRGDYTNRVN